MGLGKQARDDLKVSYYRARYYDPTVGRFMSEDPIHFRAGVNFYRYVGNNPALFTDPMGSCPASPPPTPYQKFRYVLCHPLTAAYAGGVAGVAVGAGSVTSLGGSGAGGAILTLSGEAAPAIEGLALAGPVGWALIIVPIAWTFYCL